MYRRGHVGAALFCYAPMGAVLSRIGEPGLTVLGATITVLFATVPDADEYLPINHRGATHTIWFVAAAAGLAGGIGGIVGGVVGHQLAIGVIVGVATAISLTSHLLADSITPMGIRPFYPVSTWHRSFEITPAANPRANTAMLGIGIGFALLCQGFTLVFS
jgi:inner membrane protein